MAETAKILSPTKNWCFGCCRIWRRGCSLADALAPPTPFAPSGAEQPRPPGGEVITRARRRESAQSGPDLHQQQRPVRPSFAAAASRAADPVRPRPEPGSRVANRVGVDSPSGPAAASSHETFSGRRPCCGLKLEHPQAEVIGPIANARPNLLDSAPTSSALTAKRWPARPPAGPRFHRASRARHSCHLDCARQVAGQGRFMRCRVSTGLAVERLPLTMRLNTLEKLLAIASRRWPRRSAPTSHAAGRPLARFQRIAEL